MYTGKIIKFYREKYKLTQEQLGKGICSVTHLSKIECAQTTYASEITALLCKRLGINLEMEINKLLNIKKQIFKWHDAIIMQLVHDADLIYDELEHEILIQISECLYMYRIIKAKYLLMHNKTAEAYKIIKNIQKNKNKLTQYETNLFQHVLGIYFIAKQDLTTAIETLKEIDDTIYTNPEYYYHLAVAYHSLQSHVLAYYYAEKSHNFFKNINNYLRVIDAEMLMVIQVKDDTGNDEVINRFKKLIKSCELCNVPDRKAKVLHNLGYEYLRRKIYDKASEYYLESMSLKDVKSVSYLLSLEGYIKSSFEGNLIPIEKLIQQAEKGLSIAINTNQILYIHLFRLHLYLLKAKEVQYYQYLSNKALPMFEKFGFTYLIKRSKKELFNYYYKMDLKEEALKMAQFIINT
jgi:transcriptional regulator with XRE-family HTH domain